MTLCDATERTPSNGAADEVISAPGRPRPASLKHADAVFPLSDPGGYSTKTVSCFPEWVLRDLTPPRGRARNTTCKKKRNSPMTWFWLAGAAIAGIVAGYLAGWRAVITAMRPALQQLNRNLANDRNLALGLLRRELANWMFRHDPDRYLQTYKKAHEAAKAISTTEGSEQRAELADLTEHYKCYTDFDLLGTREYVLYADALSTNTYDEVERHYTDIVRFQALQIAVDDNRSDIHHPTNEAELAHCGGSGFLDSGIS